MHGNSVQNKQEDYKCMKECAVKSWFFYAVKNLAWYKYNVL